LDAIRNAKSGPVEEGSVGAGTGTVCFGFKGGIGTASRRLPKKLGGWTIGVLVQTNFGGVLQICGAPAGKELGQYYLHDVLEPSPDGSCMIVIMTDAPLDARNLERLAKRSIFGIAKTGGIASNGSGDYAIAISTAESVRIPYHSDSMFDTLGVLRNEEMSPLFLAVIEATEEAILNSLFMATAITGRAGHTADSLPVDEVVKILEKYGVVSR
jgi:D-aminopeptidase